MGQVHEFMVVEFATGIDDRRQRLVMEALDAHFARCTGLLSRAYYRDKGGRWVKHLVWESQADLDASAGLEDDPAVAALYGCFDSQTVAYACCERFEPAAQEAAPV